MFHTNSLKNVKFDTNLKMLKISQDHHTAQTWDSSALPWASDDSPNLELLPVHHGDLLQETARWTKGTPTPREKKVGRKKVGQWQDPCCHQVCKTRPLTRNLTDANSKAVLFAQNGSEEVLQGWSSLAGNPHKGWGCLAPRADKTPWNFRTVHVSVHLTTQTIMSRCWDTWKYTKYCLDWTKSQFWNNQQRQKLQAPLSFWNRRPTRWVTGSSQRASHWWSKLWEAASRRRCDHRGWIGNGWGNSSESMNI